MIFKKTLFKKNILSLIALLLSLNSYCRLTASSSLTTSQSIQTVLLGFDVAVTNISYNGAPLVCHLRRADFFLITKK
ncbi:MAG: hypothetical protein Q7W13_11180 [Bacteroidia bacterium]|nr:hypothetical protein [Bacteroidia bacterium]